MWSADEVNVLSNDEHNQVIALGRLLREIEDATGVRRETASAYLKAAGIPVRSPRARLLPATPKPASREGVSTDSRGERTSKPASRERVSTDSDAPGPRPSSERVRAVSRAHRSCRAAPPERDRDLPGPRRAARLHFTSQYASVKRFVAKLRGTQTPRGRR